MHLTWDNPLKYIDALGNNYAFIIFNDIDGRPHFNITIEYKDSKRNLAALGYEVSAHSFSQPIRSGMIDWAAYSNDGVPRSSVMSEESIKFANRIMKMKAFL